MRTVWAAKRNSDMTEGRGPMVIIGLFEQEQSAVIAAHGWGVMGVGDGDTEPMIVWDNFTEYKDKQDNEARLKALAKLTPDEIELLGIRRR